MPSPEWVPYDFSDYQLDPILAQATSGLTVSQWRDILRICQRTRQASSELEPGGLADAVAHELQGADHEVISGVQAVLAAQMARGSFLVDIAEVDSRLERMVQADREIAERHLRPKRNRSRARDLLPIGAARRTPILDVFKRYGHHPRRHGREWWTICPFHDDNHPSLRISPSKGLWFCDPCAIGGDGLRFVMLLKGLDFPGGVRELTA